MTNGTKKQCGDKIKNDKRDNKTWAQKRVERSDLFRPDLFGPMLLQTNMSAEGGAPNCEAPKGGGLEGWEAQNFAFFFSFSGGRAVLADPAGVVICHHIVAGSKCWAHLLATRILCVSSRAHHHTLLARIPKVEDVQLAWLLLVHCASAEWLSPRWQPRHVRDMTPGCGSVCAEFST